MASVNKVILVGQLGKDPESRTFQNGGEVVSFSVATSENWKDRQLRRAQEKTEWHNVSIFPKALRGVAKSYLRQRLQSYLEVSSKPQMAGPVGRRPPHRRRAAAIQQCDGAPRQPW